MHSLHETERKYMSGHSNVSSNSNSNSNSHINPTPTPFEKSVLNKVKAGEFNRQPLSSLIKEFSGDTSNPSKTLRINISDSAGWTVLHWAVYHGSFVISLALLLCGADPNCFNFAGWSPLMLLSSPSNLTPGITNRVKLINMLLRFGADPCLKSPNLHTCPMDYCHLLNSQSKFLISQMYSNAISHNLPRKPFSNLSYDSLLSTESLETQLDISISIDDEIDSDSNLYATISSPSSSFHHHDTNNLLETVDNDNIDTIFQSIIKVPPSMIIMNEPAAFRSCHICSHTLLSISPDHVAISTCCGEMYCLSCISIWLQKSSSCPKCSLDFGSFSKPFVPFRSFLRKPSHVENFFFEKSKFFGRCFSESIIFKSMNFPLFSSSAHIKSCSWIGPAEKIIPHCLTCPFLKRVSPSNLIPILFPLTSISITQNNHVDPLTGNYTAPIYNINDSGVTKSSKVFQVVEEDDSNPKQQQITKSKDPVTITPLLDHHQNQTNKKGTGVIIHDVSSSSGSNPSNPIIDTTDTCNDMAIALALQSTWS